MDVNVASKSLLTGGTFVTVFKGLFPIILIGFIALIIKEYIKAKTKQSPRRFAKDKNEKSTSQEYTVDKKQPITKREQGFLYIAKQVFPEYQLLAQVDLKQIVKLTGGNEKNYMNELGKLSIDFVVLDKNYGLIACIELDDSTHETEKAKYNDAKKNEYLGKAKIPLLRFAEIPTKSNLKKAFESIIGKPENTNDTATQRGTKSPLVR